MSDTHVVPSGTDLLSPEAMGHFDENGVYVPRSITEDDLGGGSLEDAMAGTIVEFEDGDLVEGTVVKIDRDEVLLDIGFKSEGVIPVRELSIRNDVDPDEIVSLGEAVEALVLQKEDKEGRLILSKKRAQYERAWGTIEKLKEADEVVTGPVIEVVKGGLIVDIGLRGFLPGVPRRAAPRARAAALRGPDHRGQDHRARPQPQQRGAVPSGLAGGDPEGAAGRVPRQPQARRAPPWRRVLGRQLRCLRGPGRHGRPRARVRAVVEARRPPVLGGLGRRRDRRRGPRRRPRPRSGSASRSRPPRPTRGRSSPTPTRSASWSTAASPSWCPFGSFVQVGDGIEGLVHISEMAGHHVDLPEQVVTPGEELWVKIIDIDLQRRRISLSIKQAAEGGEVSEEYREAFGEHAYDEEGNYVGPVFAETEFTPETEAQAAWADYVAEHGTGEGAPAEGAPAEGAPPRLRQRRLRRPRPLLPRLLLPRLRPRRLRRQRHPLQRHRPPRFPPRADRPQGCRHLADPGTETTRPTPRQGPSVASGPTLRTPHICGVPRVRPTAFAAGCSWLPRDRGKTDRCRFRSSERPWPALVPRSFGLPIKVPVPAQLMEREPRSPSHLRVRVVGCPMESREHAQGRTR